MIYANPKCEVTLFFACDGGQSQSSVGCKSAKFGAFFTKCTIILLCRCINQLYHGKMHVSITFHGLPDMKQKKFILKITPTPSIVIILSNVDLLP